MSVPVLSVPRVAASVFSGHALHISPKSVVTIFVPIGINRRLTYVDAPSLLTLIPFYTLLAEFVLDRVVYSFF